MKPYQVNGSRQICFARCIMGTCERREIQCRTHGKCKQWSSCWNWNFPAAGKQTKLNLIGRIRHVTHFRANSVHLELVTRHNLPSHKVSNQFKSCDGFWIYSPLCTSNLVATHDGIGNRSIAKNSVSSLLVPEVPVSSRINELFGREVNHRIEKIHNI